MNDFYVNMWEEKATIPTYPVCEPDKNPMFLEKRVYQGSSGKVYPIPFTDKLMDNKIMQQYNMIFLENKYLKIAILPELGGYMGIAKEAVKKVVREKIRLCDCNGLADEFK